MTLLVRDEEDIVADVVEHHLGAGVDFLVATDNGSIDETVPILERYQRAGRLRLLHEPSQDYEQGRWVTRMARMAAIDHRADWVLNLDADEFVWPPDIKAALSAVPEEIGIVEVRRDNLVEDPDASGAWHQRLIIRDLDSRDLRGGRLSSKVFHRAVADVVVAQGNHDVTSRALGGTARLDAVTLLHAPDRGFAHYERKIRNGGAAYESNVRFSQGVGWHWREEYDLLKQGKLREAYEARRADIAAALDDGTLVWDTRLRDHLTGLQRTSTDGTRLAS